MQDAPIIENHGFTRLQLHCDQELRTLQDTGPLSRCGIPILQRGVVGETRRARRHAVEVVPADLHECRGGWRGDGRVWRRVVENRVALQAGCSVEEGAFGGAERGGRDGVGR